MSASHRTEYLTPSDERDLLYQYNHKTIKHSSAITVKRLMNTFNWPNYMARVFMQLYGARLSYNIKGRGSVMVMTEEKFETILKERPEWREVFIAFGGNYRRTDNGTNQDK